MAKVSGFEAIESDTYILHSTNLAHYLPRMCTGLLQNQGYPLGSGREIHHTGYCLLCQ
jgi:hypothetical protein